MNKSKRYVVLTFTKKSRMHIFYCSSLRVAIIIARLKIWDIGKITDRGDDHKCIYHTKFEKV